MLRMLGVPSRIPTTVRQCAHAFCVWSLSLLEANILRCIRGLSTASSQSAKDDLKQTIDGLSDTLVKNATAIQTKIQAVVEDLSKFGEQTYEDQSTLKERKVAVEDMLTSDADALEALQRQIEENYTELKADQAKYEHGKKHFVC